MLLSILPAILFLPSVLGAPDVQVEWSDPRVTLSGTWFPPSNCGSRYTGTIGNSASFSFRGTSITYVGGMDSQGGNIAISLDGTTVSTVDRYNSGGDLCRQTLYQNTNLPDADHVIMITLASASENRNPGMSLNYFVYTPSDAPSNAPSGGTSVASVAPSSTPGSAPGVVAAADPPPSTPAGAIAGPIIAILGLAGLLGAAHMATKPPAVGAAAYLDQTFLFAVPPPVGAGGGAGGGGGGSGGGAPLKPTQITLTLTPRDTLIARKPEESPEEPATKNVAWQVFTVGGETQSSPPLKLTHDLAFGTVTVSDDEYHPILTSETFNHSPHNHLVTMAVRNDQTIWDGPARHFHWFRHEDKFVKAKNDTKVRKSMALGSFEESSNSRGFLPFLIVGDVRDGRIVHARPELILQAYKTHDCQRGQVLDEDILAKSEPLLGQDGVDVSTLGRATTWHVTSSPSGDVKLEIARA